ncbi:MAG: efflux RND transporter periplasmic adaptor subunit [Kiritimatiellae bacterium]|nr:efflux RND transporter periplasmic adaptor subunit [Kiritimatiellia bacterium]
MRSVRFGRFKWRCAAALLAVAASGCGRRAVEEAAEPPVLVGTVRPVRHRFRETVRAQGVVRAKDVVRVAARVPGTIEAMWVEEGAEVAAGQKLFQIDRETLEHQVRIAEDAVRVAVAGRREADAAVEDARASLRKAEADHERAARMFEQDGAIPLDALELATTGRDRARAAVERAVAAAELAAARVQQAESSLAVARRQLADSTVNAPLAGVVTRRFLRAGEYAAPGVPVLQIESPDRIEVAATLDASMHGRVAAGRARMRLLRAQGPSLEAPVDYVAPTVDPRTRTFEVRATFARVPGAPAPGEAVEAEILLEEREGWAVPAVAVARRGDRATLWVVAEGRAQAKEVRLGAETDDLMEIATEDIHAAEVIVDGRGLVRDGDPVRVATPERMR